MPMAISISISAFSASLALAEATASRAALASSCDRLTILRVSLEALYWLHIFCFLIIGITLKVCLRNTHNENLVCTYDEGMVQIKAA